MILCVRVGGLGDLLAALPSLRLMRGARPGERLVLLGRTGYGGLLRDAGVVDEVVDAGGAEFAPLLAARGAALGPDAVPGPARALLEKYSCVFAWMNNPERGRGLDALLAAAGTPRFVVSLAAERGRDAAEGKSAARFFFDRTAEHLARTAPHPPASAAPGFDDCARLSGPAAGPETKERFAVIHPGSGALEKCWPLDRFLEVARRLSARGVPGGIVLGEAEERLAARLRDRADIPAGWTAMDRPPLPVLSYLLGRASLYLGNDSGVTHLAAARGAPVLALFLEKNLPVWTPFGRTRTLSAPGIASIAVERVWAETARILGLDPR